MLRYTGLEARCISATTPEDPPMRLPILLGLALTSVILPGTAQAVAAAEAGTAKPDERVLTYATKPY
jgi:hypothetical protein